MALGDQSLIREVFLRRAGDKVHPHFRAANHQGVAHVVTGITHIDKLDALQMAKVLLDCQEVRQNLGRVEFIGQAVKDRDTGVFCQILDDGLTEAPVLDAVIHPAQDPGRIGDGLFVAHLGAGGAEVRRVHAQIVRRNFEGAAGPGGGFFKNQGDILALKIAVGLARLFLCLEICRRVDELLDLSGGEVQ